MTTRPASRASRALGNLRAIVILLVLSFHSVLAYLNFLPAAPFAFDRPPYLWRAFPIVDSQRWFGFDLYCAWQDVFLMSLFFFLSGLFVWPSLSRKSTASYVHDRLRRLGLPFALAVALLMPVALYPTYLQSAAGPVATYFRHWLQLPFWPCGPMWFLWLLLVADLAAAALYAWVPRSRGLFGALGASANRFPMRFLAGVAIAAIVAYSALALAFGPSDWAQWGPFAFQLSRPAHYAVYFFAGIAAGAPGIDGRLLAPKGPLAAHWLAWLGAALASFVLWLALTGLLLHAGAAASLGLQVADYASYALACFTSCFFVLAAVLRFGAIRSPVLDSLGANAYGMYLVHYLFVVWLQYALLGAGLPAVVKGALVFAGTLAASWGSVAGFRALLPALRGTVAGRAAGRAPGAAAS